MRANSFAALGASVVVLAACGAPPADAPPGPLDCGVAPPLFDTRGDVVHGSSDDGCVRIERVAIDLGDDFLCKACPYEATRVVVRLAPADRAPLSFELRDDLSNDDGDDVGALTYEATHHNWADVVSVHGDGDNAPSAFDVRILYDVPSDGWDLEVIRIADEEAGDEALLVLPVVGSR